MATHSYPIRAVLMTESLFRQDSPQPRLVASFSLAKRLAVALRPETLGRFALDRSETR